MKKFAYIIFLLFFLISQKMSAEKLITPKLLTDAEKIHGKYAKKRFQTIDKKLLKKLKKEKPLKQLNFVNYWYNSIKYKSDQKIYGKSDYWATLYEFVGRGMGDCEDYTIAKYYTLKELGFDINRMKFAYVVYKNRRGKNISHMVLAYFKVANPKSKDDILILDNTNKKILPASKRTNIVKVIKMINGDTGAKSKKWKKLVKDMKRKKL